MRDGVGDRLDADDLAQTAAKAFDALLGVVDEVLPIDRAVVEGAKQVALQYPVQSVRVAMHVAVMQRHGIEQVLSFDQGFERVPRISRVR